MATNQINYYLCRSQCEKWQPTQIQRGDIEFQTRPLNYYENVLVSCGFSLFPTTHFAHEFSKIFDGPHKWQLQHEYIYEKAMKLEL